MSAVTYLQLAPEFGGTRYGPFRGAEIRLGSDPATNDISMPADLGVLPQHVKILQQSENSFIVAPIDRTATVYIWRENSNKPKQISTPMAVQPGDGFSLVTPEGHRFYLQVDSLKKQREAAGDGFADKAMKRMPTSRGLFDEVKRRGFAKLFTTRIGNALMYGYRFVVTGQIFSPLYIVSGIMMISGWFLASGAACTAFSLNFSKNDFASKLQECKDREDGGVGTGGRGPTVPSLTMHVLASNDWSTSLRDDRDIYRAYTKALALAFTDPARYRDSYSNEESPLGRFYRGLQSNMPPSLANTLAFVAASPSSGPTRQWRVFEDSQGVEVCGRGPLGLTYRQAKNLGLENVQLDALVTNSEALSQDIAMKREKLLETARAAGEATVSLDGTRILSPGGAGISGERECMHVEGPDDREDIPALIRAFNRELGPSVRGLPGENASHWITARLVKLAAMDFITYRDLQFQSTKPPTTNLLVYDDNSSRKQWAEDYAASVMARAVVVRCMGVLDKDLLDAPPTHMGELPELSHCLHVDGFVKYGRL